MIRKILKGYFKSLVIENRVNFELQKFVFNHTINLNPIRCIADTNVETVECPSVKIVSNRGLDEECLCFYCEFQILTEKVNSFKKKSNNLKCFTIGIHVANDNLSERYDLSFFENNEILNTQSNYSSYVAAIGATKCINQASSIVSSCPNKFKQIIIHIPCKNLISIYENKFILNASSRYDKVYARLIDDIKKLLKKISPIKVTFKHFDQVRDKNTKNPSILAAKKLSSMALKAYELEMKEKTEYK